MPPVRILRALGIITSNVTEISLLHFSLTTVERSWEKRHKIWTFKLTRGTNQTSIHSTPSAKSESGSTTFTASSSEHLCVQKLKLDAFLTQQVQSSLNRKLLTLLAEGSGRGGEEKKEFFLHEWMSFLSTQNSELSSNLTRQHCFTPSTWEGDSRWAEWLTKLNGSLFKSSQTHSCTCCIHTLKGLSVTHKHTHSYMHLLFSHCRGTVVHHSIEPTHHLLHLLPPSWGKRQRGEREQGSCEMEIRFIRWILCCHCWQRGLWPRHFDCFWDRRASVQRG